MTVTVFHNPRCSKSRAAMATVDEFGIEASVVRYLDDPPSRQALEAIVAGLEDPVTDLVRAGDARAAGLEVPADTAGVVELLLEHPELLERPVVVRADGRAIIGRPPERVAPFLAG